MQRRRRMVLVAVILIGTLGWVVIKEWPNLPLMLPDSQSQQSGSNSGSGEIARDALAALPTKGRAPKTGYKRSQFGDGWAKAGGCDTRNVILRRDLTNAVLGDDNCKVQAGALSDPYTGQRIAFKRGANSSGAVQIDHVVALSNAWQTGAQQLSSEQRISLANDPLELLAVDGPANQQKGDGDAATWLPSNKPFRCQYIARQIAVKKKYSLWVTPPERTAMERILASCPEQRLPA
ncbi:MAG: HNH endonuclease family protein [Candidatus Saccharimonas sp.]